MSLTARLCTADLQLLHALLLHSSCHETARRKIRIDRAIQAIRRISDSTTGPAVGAAVSAGRSFRRTRRLIQWAVAASLVIVIVHWLYLSSSNPAFAALEQIVQAIDAPMDRTYQIFVEPSDKLVRREPWQPRGERTSYRLTIDAPGWTGPLCMHVTPISSCSIVRHRGKTS